MNLVRRSASALALVSMAALIGCGNTGPTEVDSGLPEDKPANELTADEADQFCDAYVDAVNEKLAEVDTCSFVGYFAAALTYSLGGGEEDELRQLCADSRDQCDENAGEEPPIDVPPCMTEDMAQESCEATVGQLEDCFADQADQTVAMMDTPPCESLTIASLEEYLEGVAEEPEPTPACEAATEACPDGF